MGEAPSKKQRVDGLCGASYLLQLFQLLPKDLGTPCGDPLNVLLLRFLGNQALATCSRACFEWSTIKGQRVLLCFNDQCRGPQGPFPQIERLATSHVEQIRFAPYGRKDANEHAEVLSACNSATILRCVYAKRLAGIGSCLQDRQPFLALRRLIIHQSAVEVSDLVQLMRCSPNLEILGGFGENFSGMGEAILSELKSSRLTTVELVDCGLQAQDLTPLLELCSQTLRSLHVQSGELRGLQVPKLQVLKSLSLHDCHLTRIDAATIMRRCPALEVLSLCGNSIGNDDDDDVPMDLRAEDGEDGAEDGSEPQTPWPFMSKLQRLDVRSCGIGEKESEDLRSALPENARLEFALISLARTNGGPETDGPGMAAGRHIVFDSSSDED
eukprot:TRINITY_DN100359_c0_g1_i1.p1 TRINITY_DN100359_c0_g1~~TRINITY_DN100359_c0_g1_i1.p1  ORF type:complete len:384 (-),score=59.99 TRINITY_DN100359_c0_g1_i1:78-1229(-)